MCSKAHNPFKIAKLSSKYPLEENLTHCLQHNRLPFKQKADEAKENVLARIDVSKSSVFKNRFLKIAATVALLIVGLAAAYYFAGSKTIENNTSGIASIDLPDGSAVKLNANSRIHFNSSFWKLNRSVNLDAGEAFFEVEEGSVFTVRTPKGNVTVLGTSFNISLSENNFEVACKTGSVEVKMVDVNKSLILSPGEKVNAAGENPIVNIVSENEIDAWVKGDFIFNNVDVKDVFEVIENTTGYRVDTPSGLELNYSGQFKKSQTIEEILDIVCRPLNLDYSIDKSKKQISITKK